ncbi:MAG: hypothetical protein ACRCZT_00575 [Plesiomonas sp.]
MNISSLFRSKPVATPVETLSDHASSLIKKSTKQFISHLKSIKNTAQKQGKLQEYQNVKSCAHELKTSSKNKDLKATITNVTKLRTDSASLFNDSTKKITASKTNLFYKKITPTKADLLDQKITAAKANLFEIQLAVFMDSSSKKTEQPFSGVNRTVVVMLPGQR